MAHSPPELGEPSVHEFDDVGRTINGGRRWQNDFEQGEHTTNNVSVAMQAENEAGALPNASRYATLTGGMMQLAAAR
eukprot:CAMPEP_0170173932 /NCGR_PEP_ID=MMETSP0040_2-20121228/7196_1 /TAXON_ID=641309 /ORGANISM="Lotharella oceanica, Strain CCMP622" /LENGTH=76 /DNA_ID=CAMNT_0010415353 /DNA_START=244 /DNA_END=475 /DNA_ORIENTATION=-